MIYPAFPENRREQRRGRKRRETAALPPGAESPYRLLVAPLLERHRTPVSQSDRETMLGDPDLRRLVNTIRSTLPAAKQRR
jgi:hypothetical protein